MFWVAEGLAVLVKGPVVPLVGLCTVMALIIADRRGGWLMRLRPALGVPLLLAIVLPWFWMVQRATGGAFLAEAIGHDLLPKLVGGQEAHGAPPGYYLVLLIACFWPGSLFLAAGGSWALRHRRIASARVLLAWVVPAWLIFELVPTKLPHYVLPLYPALALACGRALVAIAEEGMPPVRRWVSWAMVLPWGAVGLAVGILVVALPVRLDGILGGASALAVGGAFATVLHMARSPFRYGPGSAAAVVCGAAIVAIPTFTAILPQLNALWLSRRAAALVVDGGHLSTRPIVAVGYAEPSLVFLLGTGTRLLPADAAADLLAQHGASLALISDREDEAFRSDLAARRLTPRTLGAVSGLDYSNGRWMTLTLYTVAER
jgi:4-amino-4-deoxy-L-arabinose transferase-like glycosyltransferase